MNPLKLAVLLGMFASSAQAVLIVNDISGDANSLHLAVNFAFDPLPMVAPFFHRETLIGSWNGGSFQVIDFFGKTGTPEMNEGVASLSIKATWDDGWYALVFSDHYFLWGTTRLFETPDYPPVTRTINGLSYQFQGSYDATIATLSDFSGSGNIVFDLRRSSESVPDSGSALLLFGIGIASAEVVRRHSARLCF